MQIKSLANYTGTPLHWYTGTSVHCFYFPLNDSKVFISPSLAETGISTIPIAFLIFSFETTYDSVSFLSRSEFNGKCNTSPIFAIPRTNPAGIFKIFAFLSCDKAIILINTFVDSASSYVSYYNIPCVLKISARSGCFFEYSRSIFIRSRPLSSAHDAGSSAGFIAVRRSQII